MYVTEGIVTNGWSRWNEEIMRIQDAAPAQESYTSLIIDNSRHQAARGGRT